MADKIPDNLRAFDDMDSARKWMRDGAIEALGKRFPIEDDTYRLELADPHYVHENSEYGMKKQKEALLKRGYLADSVKGTWRLVEKATGRVLDEKQATVMRVPYLTNRGTFIYNGNEYSAASQSRLKHGVYTRKRQSGEIESFYSIKPGTGRNFKMWMEPKTGVFKMNVGQANMPLYPLLKELGVSDEQLVNSWGKEVAAANADANWDARDMRRYYEKFMGKAPGNLSDAEVRDAVRAQISRAEVDPWVVSRTLGLENVSHVGPDMLLRGAQKILNVSRGEEKPDDRNAPMFSRILSPEDFIRERIENDAGRVARTLLFKSRRAGNLSRVPAGALDSYTKEYLIKSRLTQPLEETNPLSLLDQMGRITRMGEGGIGSAEAVTKDARDVNLGQLGFIDPIAGPECAVSGSYIMTYTGFKPVEEITADDKIACLVDGKLEYHKPNKVIVEDYDGIVYGAKTKFISYKVTANHRLWFCPYEGTLGYRFGYASEVNGRHIRLMTGGHVPYDGNPDFKFFTVPYCDPKKPGQRVAAAVPPIDIVTWASFLGWFLTRGNVTARAVYITQSTPEYVEILKSILAKMHLTVHDRVLRDHRNGQKAGFVLYNVHLASYLSQFGHSWEKFIPEYMFEAPVEARRALFDAMCMGDGRRKMGTWSYGTTSKRLADDFERLAFSLGIATNQRFEKDDRSIARRTGGLWVVHVNKNSEQTVFGGNAWHKNQYFSEPYKGKVYCVSVPGGRFFYRHGDRGAHWTGNSETIGIDTRVAHRTFKGKDGQMYGEFRDVRTGKMAYLKPEDLADRTLAFPGEMASDKPTAYVSKDGRIQEVPKEEVDYEVPGFGHMMNAMANLNPMPTSVQAARQFYGSKFWGQYMPATKGETPLVDSVMEDGTSFSEYYGRRVGCIPAKQGGKVLAVKDDVLKVKYDDGSKGEVDLVKNLPMNRLTQMSYDTTLKPGDTFKAGDVLAYNNFVDPKTGAFAMGHELRVAIIPARGWSHEDAQVYSESAAKRLSTNRLYGFDQDFDNDVKVDFKKFTALFPDKFTKEQLKGIGDDGVAKPGTVLQYGDPIVLAVGPKLLGPEDVQLGKLSKALRHAQTDRSTVWEHEYPGTVTDAEVTNKGVSVNVKADVPLDVGDKCCYSPDTEVLTKDGWRTFPELGYSDEIAALDPETLETGWLKPKEIMAFPHDGPMWEFDSEYVSLHVTGNHKLFVYDEYDFRRKMVEASAAGSWKYFSVVLDDPRSHTKNGYLDANTYAELPKPEIRKRHKEGVVWCCELPKWHVLYVRRNNKAVWCGNSTRYGLKGVCSKVVPDEQMPRDPVTNEPYDVLLNPMTILSRVAPNQLMEIGLGKVAKKTGVPYRLPQLPPKEGWAKWALAEMEKNGVPEKEALFDPETGKTTPPVMTGYMYVLPFHHLSEKKLSGRGSSGVAYSSDELPVKGGGSGAQAKRMSGMDNVALICHGALDVLKDSQTIRGAKNDAMWKALKLGQPLPEPQVPFVYEKFLNLMRAGGINVMKRGNNNLDLLPMTDKDVERLSGGAVSEAQMVDKDMEPVPGGLFDTAKAGGLSGKKWTHVDLPEPIPNPVYEEPVCRLLGLSRKKFRDILAGRELLDGEYGGLAFKKALSKIDVEDEIEKQKRLVSTTKGSTRDNAVKCLGYLDALRRQNLSPKDWIITKVPVLPPVFRPVSRLGDTLLQADINELYRDVIESGKSLSELRKDLPDRDLHDERETLYDSVAAAYGLGDPVTPEGAAKGLKGALRTITGNGSPKFGFYQSRVLSKPMDMVGRGVITPNPNADMDSIGLPEGKAWELYKDFILRRLTRAGVPGMKALEMIERKDPAARRALLDEMQYRPVLMDRAPTWHKFNILAYRPYVKSGKTVNVSPLILAGLNGDFDGDFQENYVFLGTCQSTPFTSRREAERLGKGTIVSMETKRGSVLIKDKFTVRAVDLADFPHGELIGRRKDAKYDVDFYEVPKGLYVFAYDEKLGKVVMAEVAGWSEHRGKALEIVTLSGGEQIYTDDDPRGVYGIDPEGSRGFDLVRMTPTEALERGAYVPVSSQPIMPSGVRLKLDTKTQEVGKEGIEMGFDFGVVVGILSAGGTKPRREEAKAALKSCARKAGMKQPDLSSLSEAIYSEDETERRLPLWFHSGNKEFLEGVACGMMLSAGGFAKIPKVRKSGAKAWEAQAQMCSCSLGLLRGLRRVLSMLGVHSFVSFSRKTSSGNENWVLNLSATEAKFAGVFDRMPDEGMLRKWKSVSAGLKQKGVVHDIIPVPKAALRSLTAFVSQYKACNLYHTAFESRRKYGHVTRQCGERLREFAEKVREDLSAKYDEACAVLDRLLDLHRWDTEPFEVSEEDRKALMGGVDAIHPRQCGRMPEDSLQARACILEMKKGPVYVESLHRIFRHFSRCKPHQGMFADPQFRKFLHMLDSPVAWRKVKKVEKTGKVIPGYDLTVPGHETFMSADGVILSNTVNFHVPVSDKAVQNALDKMLPSKNLISLTDLRESMSNPRQEMALGLYALTRPASNKPPVRFRTAEEAKAAYRQGKIKANDPIIIG